MPAGKHLLGMPGDKFVFGTVRVGEKGQIVIPKEARRQFGIRSGDTLLILGDRRSGIVVSKPEVIQDAANRVFQQLDSEEGDPVENSEE